jgi:hypothetical protein
MPKVNVVKAIASGKTMKSANRFMRAKSSNEKELSYGYQNRASNAI